MFKIYNSWTKIQFELNVQGLCICFGLTKTSYILTIHYVIILLWLRTKWRTNCVIISACGTVRKSCNMSNSRFCEPMNSFMQVLLQSNFKTAAKIHYAFEINQTDLFGLIFDLENSRIRQKCIDLTWEAYILTIHFVIILLLQPDNHEILCQ